MRKGEPRTFWGLVWALLAGALFLGCAVDPFKVSEGAVEVSSAAPPLRPPGFLLRSIRPRPVGGCVAEAAQSVPDIGPMGGCMRRSTGRKAQEPASNGTGAPSSHGPASGVAEAAQSVAYPFEARLPLRPRDMLASLAGEEPPP